MKVRPVAVAQAMEEKRELAPIFAFWSEVLDVEATANTSVVLVVDLTVAIVGGTVIVAVAVIIVVIAVVIIVDAVVAAEVGSFAFTPPTSRMIASAAK